MIQLVSYGDVTSKLTDIERYSGVGSLAVLPVDAGGRFTGFPMVAGHSAHMTDFDFSPFNNDLLATGSEDCMVKLWSLPSALDLKEDVRLTNSLLSFGPFGVSA